MNPYLEKLEKTDNSLMIYKHEQLIFQSNSKGIRPHLEAIELHGSELEETLMVDKIIGRAAAFLIVYSKPAKAIAAVISSPGKEVLDEQGVEYLYREETPHIKMENGVIYCPFERMVQGINDPVEAYHAIVEKMNSFKQASSS